MLFNQRSQVHREAWFQGGDNIQQQTDMATYRLNQPRGRFSENEYLQPLLIDSIFFSPMKESGVSVRFRLTQ